MKSSDIERRERRELIGSTGTETFQSYRDRAFAEMALEAHGRHAAVAKASVTGRDRVPQVPRQPEGSPWHSDPVPPEGPLGYAIDSQECTGEVFEVAASVAIPSNDAASAREDVDATPPRSAAPTSGMSPREVGVTPSPEPGLRRGRKL